MTQIYIATGQSRSLRLEPLSLPEYRSRDSSGFISTTDFSSPKIIEDILSDIPQPSIPTASYSNRVNTMVNKIEEVFKMITEDLNQVKTSIVSRIVAFPEESLTAETQSLIRKELEKCRQKVVSSNFSTKALDEFATLVSNYRNLSLKSTASQANEEALEWMLAEIKNNIKEYYIDFHELITRIKNDVLELSKGKPNNEFRELKKLEEENTQKKFDFLFQNNSSPKVFKPQDWVFSSELYCKERKLSTFIPRKLTPDEFGTLARVHGKEYLVLLDPPSQSRRYSEVLVCHKDSKKYLKKRTIISSNENDEISGKSKLIYIDDLNSILVFDGEKVSLFSVSSRGLKRIAVLSNKPANFVDYIPKAKKVIFVYNTKDRELPTMIEVIDLLTRKVVQQKDFEKIVSDCLYMKNRDSFVIVSKELLSIYKVTNTGCIGQLSLQVPIETAYNTGSRIFCQGNLLVIRENYLQPGRMGIELQYERFQMVLIDKRNRYELQKCEVCTKDELWEESREVIVLPGLNKMVISFSDMGASLVELNMKKKITKLLEKEDYLELKDHRILAKSEGGDRLIIAKKDGIYEWTLKL